MTQDRDIVAVSQAGPIREAGLSFHRGLTPANAGVILSVGYT